MKVGGWAGIATFAKGGSRASTTHSWMVPPWPPRGMVAKALRPPLRRSWSFMIPSMRSRFWSLCDLSQRCDLCEGSRRSMIPSVRYDSWSLCDLSYKCNLYNGLQSSMIPSMWGCEGATSETHPSQRGSRSSATHSRRSCLCEGLRRPDEPPFMAVAEATFASGSGWPYNPPLTNPSWRGRSTWRLWEESRPIFILFKIFLIKGIIVI